MKQKQTNKTYREINEMKSWLLEKINEFVAKLATGVGVGVKTQISKIKDKMEILLEITLRF